MSRNWLRLDLWNWFAYLVVSTTVSIGKVSKKGRMYRRCESYSRLRLTRSAMPVTLTVPMETLSLGSYLRWRRRWVKRYHSEIAFQENNENERSLIVWSKDLTRGLTVIKRCAFQWYLGLYRYTWLILMHNLTGVDANILASVVVAFDSIRFELSPINQDQKYLRSAP